MEQQQYSFTVAATIKSSYYEKLVNKSSKLCKLEKEYSTTLKHVLMLTKTRIAAIVWIN